MTSAEKKVPAILGIYGLEGGSGKTSLAVSLANFLCSKSSSEHAIARQRVLLVDASTALPAGKRGITIIIFKYSANSFVCSLQDDRGSREREVELFDPS